MVSVLRIRKVEEKQPHVPAHIEALLQGRMMAPGKQGTSRDDKS